MKSTILTKINTQNLTFSQQIEVHNSGKGDINFLKAFVILCHKNADFLEKDNSISVFSRKTFLYTIYRSYIVRFDLESGKKKFFKIS